MSRDPHGAPSPISLVTTDMRVVDATGAEIGRVTSVRPGDPNAVTAQDPPDGYGVLGDRVPHTERGDEPAVPPDIAARLLRSGYLRVDTGRIRSDVPSSDLYIEAPLVAGVHRETVELAVTRDRLPPES